MHVQKRSNAVARSMAVGEAILPKWSPRKAIEDEARRAFWKDRRGKVFVPL